jgi:hypothetical protein
MKKIITAVFFVSLVFVLVGCEYLPNTDSQKGDDQGTVKEEACYKTYSGNLTPMLVASFEYPCDWTVPVTGGKVTSPDGTAVFQYPAPNVGLALDTVSEDPVEINGQSYDKVITYNDVNYVEYVDLGSIEGFELDMIFYYQEDADRDELYRILETFTF